MKHETSPSARGLGLGLALVTAAVLVPGAARAGGTPTRELAQAVGIGETELRQWLGKSPLTYRQLREDSSRTSAKLLRALGRERHARLMAGAAVPVEVVIDGRSRVLEMQRGR